MSAKPRLHAAPATFVSLAVILTLALAARADAYVYWTNLGPPSTIGRAALTGGGGDQSFITGASSPGGVAVDDAHIYWTNESLNINAIGRANIDGSGRDQSFINLGINTPGGVAVDGAHIYWTNVTSSGASTIGRANLDGTGADPSFISGASFDPNIIIPPGVAVDDAHVYWANSGTNTIGRANLDGTNVDPSFITGASSPQGVAVDGAYVYWTNRSTNTIGRANLDGTGADQSFITGASAPDGVAVGGPYHWIFWTNFNANTIGRSFFDGSGANQNYITGADFPHGIAVDSLPLGLGGGPPPSSPKCGDTITTDVTLHHNLVNCPNNGLVIGADNVTLDLNYHTIDGDGKQAAGCDNRTEFCDVGVANDEHDGVTVIHGSIRQFGGGVNIFGKVRHNRVLDISASQNQAIGIQLFRASRSLIQSSSGTGASVRHEGTGLGLFDCHRVRILHNSFRHNGEVGIRVNDSNHNLIKGNRLSRNGGEGLLMGNGERNRIRRNRLIRNGAGITLGPGSHNVIKRNRIFRGRDGIRIEKGHGNLVAHNRVTHARRAGIRLGIPHPFLGGAHNVVRGNVVRRSRVDGFLVNAKDDHSLLRHNTARGAGDDGFDIDSRTATLTRNRARRNGDLGIEAVRGVNDGGGNKASGNGDPRQCTHIVCS